MCASYGLSWRAKAIRVKHSELVGVVLLILCAALMARGVRQLARSDVNYLIKRFLTLFPGRWRRVSKSDVVRERLSGGAR